MLSMADLAQNGSILKQKGILNYNVLNLLRYKTNLALMGLSFSSS
jgi:hypothetical protein